MLTQTDRLTYHFLAAAALLAFGLAPREFASGRTLRVRDSLSNESASRTDLELIERGYYEQILETKRPLDQAARPTSGNSSSTRFGNAFIHEERLTRQVNDIREYVSRPNLKRDIRNQIPWTTNSFGMRDLEYALIKPKDTFRIAFAGDSIGMGWGVGDGEGFEPRLELIFNDRSRSAGGPAVEILNFAVPGHGPGQRWFHFSEQAWRFQPDLVIYESSPADPGWDERRLRHLLAHDVGFDAPVYEHTLKTAGIQPGSSAESYRSKLKPLKWNLLAGVYQNVADECRSRSVPCIFVLVPKVDKPMETAEREHLLQLANKAGFAAIIDASDAFLRLDPSTLRVAENDYHPNALGHERIALRLNDLLSGLPLLSRLWSADESPPVASNRRAESSRQGTKKP